MFKTINQPHNLHILTNPLKVNLLEAIQMLKYPNQVSNTVECSKLEPQPGKWYICTEYNHTKLMSDGIKWQATGTNLLRSDKKLIMQVEYFESENLYKSVFKLTEKNRYNATLINYAQSSNSNITDPPKNEIRKPRFLSRKRSIKSIMKDRLKKKKKSTIEEIVNDQSNIEPIRNIHFDLRTLGADYSLPGTSSSISTPDCSAIHPFQYFEHVLHEDVVIESSAFEANVSPKLSFEVPDKCVGNALSTIEPTIISPKTEGPSTINIDSYTSHTNSKTSENLFKGRRVVDVYHIFNQIQNTVHVNDIGCSFLDMTLINEKQFGFRTVFKFICKMCNAISYIESEKQKPDTYMPINQSAVSGAIAIGIGYSQLSELCATMDIPCMSSNTFLSVQEDISQQIHTIAEREMQIAGEEERRLAIESGSINTYGTPMCTVVADGQFSKRSYKTNYDAFSGVATIIGYKSKKILFIGIRNRYCAVCQRAKNKGIPKSEHTCFLNWSKGTTSMEADLIVEGFKRSMELHGLKYNKLIGDGDSRVTKRLSEIMPYGPEFHVQKIECRNHLLRNYGTKLSLLTKNIKFPYLNLRKHIQSNIIRFRSAIVKSIEYRSKLINQSDNDKRLGLHKDILNSFHHILGSHVRCEKYFCNGPKLNENKFIDDAEKSKVIDKIRQLANQLVTHADSLLMNVDNNVCQHFNSQINKHLSGELINFSQRQSYNTRVEAAIVSYNTSRQFLRKLHKNVANEISPGDIGKKYLKIEQIKSEK